MKRVLDLIKRSKSIYALTGAGISTNAGIPDFRGPRGIYKSKKFDPDKLFDINYFLINPKYFYQFFVEFLDMIDKVEPTFTHKFFSKLESLGILKGVITQNIDSLHEKAGSRNIVNLHGSINGWYCINCEKRYSLKEVREKISKEFIPKCDYCEGVIRPDIVFFGEEVHDFYKALEWIKEATLLFVVGTALKVYPASLLPKYIKGDIVIVNKGEVYLDYLNNYIFFEEDIDQFFLELDKKLFLEEKND